MAKCANCSSEAFYTYAITPSYGIDYCSRHVPKFLQGQKNAGMLPLRVAEISDSVAPAPVVEEPVVEEAPVVEEEVVLPPKKSSKKKAVVEPLVEEAPTE
jgi:hypothetical protein